MAFAVAINSANGRERHISFPIEAEAFGRQSTSSAFYGKLKKRILSASRDLDATWLFRLVKLEFR